MAESEDKQAEPTRLGRKRDHTRDREILEAALDVIAEVGYEGMTMDMVAARARAGKATVYRRWASKPELVLEAVAHLKRETVDLDQLPDTGTLRGDLLAFNDLQAVEQADRRLAVMSGLASRMAHDLGLAEACSDAAIGPWIDAGRALILRAIDRGEFSADVDVQTLSRILPSMGGYRTLVERKPIDGEFFLTLIDHVLLPALRGSPNQSTPQAQGEPVSLNVITHLNFRGQAREALNFYQSVFGGDLTIVTYEDMHSAQDPADADQVMWGQVHAENGFHIMAYDVQSGRSFDRGDRSFYVAMHGQTEEEIKTSWAGLSQDATILQPLEPAQFAPLYGMLTDRFGITWIIDVIGEHAS